MLAAVAAGVAALTLACVPPPTPGPTTSTSTTSTSTTSTSTTTVPCPTFPTPPAGPGTPSGAAELGEQPVTGVRPGCEKPVRFSWSGQTPGQLIYVDICREPSSSPTFQPGEDCAPLSSQNPTATSTGSGSTVVSIFRGREPSGDLDWGCFAAADTPPPGVQKVTTCYVRVTNNNLFNSAAARDAAFTLA